MNALLLSSNAPGSAWTLTTGEGLAWVVMLTIISIGMLAILAVSIYLAYVLKKALSPETAPELAKPNQSFWQRFTGLRPMSHEKELALEHTYDGIVELDNPTPPWFMYLFYVTIGFGVI